MFWYICSINRFFHIAVIASLLLKAKQSEKGQEELIWGSVRLRNGGRDPQNFMKLTSSHSAARRIVSDPA